MANSLTLPIDTTRTADAADVAPARKSALSLSAVDLGTPARVVHLELDEDLCAWLRAVGIGEGERIVVLRRAAFGGPIHVRTSAGGEFALNRSLARSIRIHLHAEGEEPGA
jgi:ferrous iron transport protein A